MTLSRILLSAGGCLLILGAFALILERLGLTPGRLPGDFTWRGRNWVVSLPIGTSILLSLALTLILWLVNRTRS